MVTNFKFTYYLKIIFYIVHVLNYPNVFLNVMESSIICNSDCNRGEILKKQINQQGQNLHVYKIYLKRFKFFCTLIKLVNLSHISWNNFKNKPARTIQFVKSDMKMKNILTHRLKHS